MIQKSYDNTPTLYVVPTPIGNLEDITLRALNILKEVYVVFAEDTRTTNILLNHYNISKKLISNHLYNEEKTKEKALNYLKKGKSIAVVSDAGTPVISDPGYTLVRAVIKEDFNVVCLPGATAIIPAVVMSGLAGGPFTYYGFLNSKDNKRKQELGKLKNNKYPLVIYESPHRIKKTLNDMLEIFGNRQIALVREISKKYEEILRDTIENILKMIDNIKGELVIVIEGNKELEEFSIPIMEHIKIYMNDGLAPKEAIKKVAKERNIPKSEVYNEYLKNRN